MNDQIDKARNEAVQEVASVILKAAGLAMIRHGADPRGSAIVTTDFVMAVLSMGKHIDPAIPTIICTMLSEELHVDK